jgi:hypothetical protein
MDICIHIIVIHFILSRIWQRILLKNDVKSIDQWLINDDGEIKFWNSNIVEMTTLGFERIQVMVDVIF